MNAARITLSSVTTRTNGSLVLTFDTPTGAVKKTMSAKRVETTRGGSHSLDALFAFDVVTSAWLGEGIVRAGSRSTNEFIELCVRKNYQYAIVRIPPTQLG